MKKLNPSKIDLGAIDLEGFKKVAKQSSEPDVILGLIHIIETMKAEMEDPNTYLVCGACHRIDITSKRCPECGARRADMNIEKAA